MLSSLRRVGSRASEWTYHGHDPGSESVGIFHEDPGEPQQANRAGLREVVLLRERREGGAVTAFPQLRRRAKTRQQKHSGGAHHYEEGDPVSDWRCRNAASSGLAFFFVQRKDRVPWYDFGAVGDGAPRRTVFVLAVRGPSKAHLLLHQLDRDHQGGR